MADFAISPGEYLVEEMDERQITRVDLAEILNVSMIELERLLAGKALMTHESASRLEAAWSTPARVWMKLNEIYMDALSANAERYEFIRGNLVQSKPSTRRDETRVFVISTRPYRAKTFDDLIDNQIRQASGEWEPTGGKEPGLMPKGE